MGALSNVYDPEEVLWKGCPCGLHATMYEHQAALTGGNGSRFYAAESTDGASQRETAPELETLSDLQSPAAQSEGPSWDNQEEVMANVAKSALLKGLFGTDMNRRNFLRAVGSTTAAAAIASIIPIDKAIANILDANGPLEKVDLNVGFVPITCATPIIMAKPMGFYEKYGFP